MANFYDLLERDPQHALRDVTARREVHRLVDHGSVDLEEFFDCALCGVLNRQLGRALEATKGG